MVGIRSFYLSRVLNAKVRTPNGKQIGILHDFIATSAERPKVVACIVKMSGALKILDWNQCSIDKEKGYRVSCGQAVEISIPEHAIYLKKHIMDKQIVDIDGKKVVRVNDVRLASISSGLFVMAVPSIEEARALTETDPVIVNGEMVAEYHPWYGTAALMTVNETHQRIAPTAE